MGKPKSNVTREMPALSMRAAFVPSTFDADKRTVQLTWTTGSRVLRGVWERYWEELSLNPKHVRMGRLNAGAPLLDTHQADGIRSVIGVVESASLKKGEGVATVRFDSGVEGSEAMRKVQEGILRNVSVGYRVHKMEKVEDGEDKTPVYRAIDWEPHELSMVPIGADADAGVRSADSERNPCVFVTRNKETKMEDDEIETPSVPAAQLGESPAVTATRAAATARIEDAKARAEAEQVAAEKARAEERIRCSEIRKLGKRFQMPDSWVTNMVDSGASVREVKDALLTIGRNGDDDFNPSARIAAGEDERDKFIRGASASFFARSGVRTLLEQAKKKNPDAFADVSFDAGEFRGFSPMDLARECLKRGNVNTRGMDRMKLVGTAFTHRSTNYQTTSDFPILLENVLGKVLLGAYAVQPNTWERICKIDTVSDFRSSNRYRTGSLPGLDVLAEHAEYQSGIVPDGSKYPVSTQRMGKMFSLSRETIVNDDMGALLDLAMKLGQAAQRSIENEVYDLINENSGLGPTQGDAQPFFHSNRANVNSTGSTLSVSGIDADATVMALQTDPNGEDYLDLQPAVLLVPRSLRGTGLEVNDAQFDFDNAGSNTTGKFMRPNKVRGMFRDVVASPRITGTRRYIIADPLDWIVVAFLDDFGRGPVMESRDGWRIDGVEWKVTVYAKAQMGDPKAAVTNAGTS